MIKLLVLGMVVWALGMALFSSASDGAARSADAGEAERLLSHDVYFTLNDGSDEAKRKLVGECKKYLAKHPGVVFFAAGAREAQLERPVNDRDFDVALHIVFSTRADHDRYQTSEGHLRFIAENKANWKTVRVFDSVAEPIWSD